jgi:hypothetical protein
MARFLDPDHPMFRKRWVRVAITVLPALWSIVEFRTGAPLWGAAFLGLAAYAGWTFFLNQNEPPKDPPA